MQGRDGYNNLGCLQVLNAALLGMIDNTNIYCQTSPGVLGRIVLKRALQANRGIRCVCMETGAPRGTLVILSG